MESNSFITVNQEEVETKRKDIQSYISVEKEVVLLKDAIEIVKQGGVNDDACEWKIEETTGIVWHCNNECTTYNPAYAKNLKIILEDFECKCPYCGKKIKVVE